MAEQNENTPVEKKTVEDQKLLAALSYLCIVSIVMYVLKKDNEYIKFHAKQGIVIFALSLISVIPVVGWFLAPFISIAALILIIIGAIKAYQGEKYKLPVISSLAEKINF